MKQKLGKLGEKITIKLTDAENGRELMSIDVGAGSQ